MEGMHFGALAERLGIDLDQVLEIASLGRDLPSVSSAPVAGRCAAPRVVLGAVDLDRSRAERARPESDAEYAAGERYFERWSV